MSTAYGKKALSREYISLKAKEGESKGVNLAKTTYRLGQLVGGEQLSKDDVVSAMLRACKDNGLTQEIGKNAVLIIIHEELDRGIGDPKGPAARKEESLF
jgi:hypothetical protein